MKANKELNTTNLMLQHELTQSQSQLDSLLKEQKQQHR